MLAWITCRTKAALPLIWNAMMLRWRHYDVTAILVAHFKHVRWHIQISLPSKLPPDGYLTITLMKCYHLVNTFLGAIIPLATVYPKKYAHGFCFAVLCCGYTLTDFPISIRLTSLTLWQSNDCPSASKATLMNMDKYFMSIHYERLYNHNKAKHNKTVCISLGICCITFTKANEKYLHVGEGHYSNITSLNITATLQRMQYVVGTAKHDSCIKS